ncbi:MAG: hypothetical protein K8S94_05080 [Planctomycetia bacterium]|nr:hypothetical protein [Planctomycetia bacterium]
MNRPSPHPITVTTAPRAVGHGCVNDIAELAKTIPLFPVEREMRVADVAAARSAAARRIGWAAIFLKGYALVAREMPVLRSWLTGRFVPRIATSSLSVGILAMNRIDDGTDRLFFARLASPDIASLPLLQAAIDRFATEPTERVFRRQRQLESLPQPLRRAILRWNMRSLSPKRATRIGTFSLSTLAGLGATNRFHPTLCTTSLSYGPLDAEGRCLVTAIADHRVLDGAAVARALGRLEEVLANEIVAELRSVPAAPAGAAA